MASRPSRSRSFGSVKYPAAITLVTPRNLAEDTDAGIAAQITLRVRAAQAMRNAQLLSEGMTAWGI
jgi:hypothetical protein